METCPKHRRWTRLDYADGTVKTRCCPECPKPRPAKTYVHLPTGRIIRPAIPTE